MSYFLYCNRSETTQLATSTTLIVCRSAANVFVLPLRGQTCLSHELIVQVQSLLTVVA